MTEKKFTKVPKTRRISYNPLNIYATSALWKHLWSKSAHDLRSCGLIGHMLVGNISHMS